MKSMSVWNCLLVGMIVTSGGGCRSPLADERMAVTKSWHRASNQMVVAGRTYQKVADHYATEKHRVQSEAVTKSWTKWVASHTDANGRLVSHDPTTGELVPLSAATLAREVSRRDKNRSLLARSKTIWAASTDSWTSALDSFGLVNADTLTTQEAIDEAEKSADEALKRVGGFLATLAATAILAL